MTTTRSRRPRRSASAPASRRCSGVIDQASALSIERWRQLAHAKAREADREVIADHRQRPLDVTARPSIPAARRATARPASSGSRRTDPGFIAYMADLRGRRSRSTPTTSTRRRRRLTRLGSLPLAPLRGGARRSSRTAACRSPSRVEDRRPRTIGVGGTLSTIDGVGVTAFWLHRNLFGRAEQLRFDAGVDGLGGSLNPDDYDYNLGVTFTRPGVFNPDTNFVTSLDRAAGRLRHLPRAVDHRARPASQPHVRRPADRRALRRGLAGPLRGRLRHPPLHDLRAGRHRRLRPARRSARRHPRLLSRASRRSRSTRRSTATRALQATLEGRVYRGFGAGATGSCSPAAPRSAASSGPTSRKARPTCCSSPAAAARCAAIAYRSIGVETIDTPDDEDSRPSSSAARGLFEASGEVRYRINERFGAVGFVDAGFVTENSEPLRRQRPAHRRRARRALLYRHRHPARRPRHAAQPDADDSRRRALHRHRTGVLKRLLVSARRARARGDRRAGAGRGRATATTASSSTCSRTGSPPPAARSGCSGVSGALSSRARIAAHHHLRRARAPGSRSTTSSSTGAGSRCCAAGSTSTG